MEDVRINNADEGLCLKEDGEIQKEEGTSVTRCANEGVT